ncbi:MAG: hypothetical protein H3C35_13340, partial [Bacteroidetes bacterium]|nr:hypothetical protein [Bacteroidota bacterium]
PFLFELALFVFVFLHFPTVLTSQIVIKDSVSINPQTIIHKLSNAKFNPLYIQTYYIGSGEISDLHIVNITATDGFETIQILPGSCYNLPMYGGMLGSAFSAITRNITVQVQASVCVNGIPSVVPYHLSDTENPLLKVLVTEITRSDGTPYTLGHIYLTLIPEPEITVYPSGTVIINPDYMPIIDAMEIHRPSVGEKYEPEIYWETENSINTEMLYDRFRNEDSINIEFRARAENVYGSVTAQSVVTIERYDRYLDHFDILPSKKVVEHGGEIFFSIIPKDKQGSSLICCVKYLEVIHAT